MPRLVIPRRTRSPSKVFTAWLTAFSVLLDCVIGAEHHVPGDQQLHDMLGRCWNDDAHDTTTRSSADAVAAPRPARWCDACIQINEHQAARSLHCQAHRLRLPNSSSVLCVPQKNGNRNFGGLVARLWTGHVPSRTPELARDAMAPFDNTTVDGRSDVLLVARDPRSRLLAFYLHQIAPHAKGRRWCRYNPNCKGHARSIGFDPKRPPSFAQFVELVAKRAKQRGGDVCFVEHHLCSQVSGCLFGAHVRSTTVLKLEEMPLWYADFAAHVGIGPLELDGDQWLPYTNQSCFYSPQGGGCLPWDAWPRREAPGRSHPGGGGISNGSVQWSVAAAGRHDPVHPTGASTLVSSYYGNVSSATSQLVAALYRDDYRLLGYASPKGRAKHHPFKFHETIHGVPQPQDTKVGELVRSDR